MDDLFTRSEDQRDALVELAREVVRFPTVIPPGEVQKPVCLACGQAESRPPEVT